MKIMIVDDHAAIRLLLSSMLTLANKEKSLEKDSLELVEFESGEEAIAQYAIEDPGFRRTAKKFEAIGFVSKEPLSDVQPILRNITHT